MDETDIAVKVKTGEVTLSGYARNYFEKYQAETAVKRIKGVAAVANDIEVRSFAGTPTDPEIARAAVAALKFELPSFWENLRAVVQKGQGRARGHGGVALSARASRARGPSPRRSAQRS